MLWDRWEAHRPTDLNAMGQDLTAEEMNLLVFILQSPISQPNREQAMEDYIKIIQTEAIKGKRPEQVDDSALMAYRQQKHTEETT
jgi:hypothetical protein